MNMPGNISLQVQQAIQTVQQFKDGLGKGLDPAIVMPVAAMLYSGLQTSQSCQGHAEHGLPYLWIHFEPKSSLQLESLLQEYPLLGWAVVNLVDSCRLVPSHALVEKDGLQVPTLAVMHPEFYEKMNSKY